MGNHDRRDRTTDATDPKSDPPGTRQDPAAGPRNGPDPKAGMDREVGDLDDPDAVEKDGALPGRMGGGLAGG